MARVEYVDLLPSEEITYYRGLTAQDRFTYSRVTRKVAFLSKAKKVVLGNRSFFGYIATFWSGLTDEQKQAWRESAALINLSNWQLFIQDQAARFKAGLEGSATPSLLHQSWIGQIHIEAPADEIKIVQLHPRSYWVSQKVYGKKGMYEPVLVTEDFALPLKIGLKYKSNLVASNGSPSAKFYADIWSSYQGQDIHNLLEIELGLQDDWNYKEATLTSVLGYVVGYTLYFELSTLTGDLYIDNIIAEHSSQNWARDPYCKDINQGFTRAFYQIPKHWAAITLPEGAFYESVYKDF